MSKCRECRCSETHADEHPGLCCDCADTEYVGERIDDLCCIDCFDE